MAIGGEDGTLWARLGGRRLTDSAEPPMATDGDETQLRLVEDLDQHVSGPIARPALSDSTGA